MKTLEGLVLEEMEGRENVFLEMFVGYLNRTYHVKPESAERAIKLLVNRKKLKMGERVKIDGEDLTYLHLKKR